MKKVIDLAERIAPSNSTVLIEGETGTGKEVIANFIHKKSPRKDKPFVVVNCGALPENLLERELFGHAKGAFTGAVESKPGLIEVADEGTLFLDEIGEMSMQGQIVLLRVLETGLFRRLGETKEDSVDIRVIVATNIDLNVAVKEKRFREDLYHRLNVIRVTIPALRERKEDIAPLAFYFLKNFTQRGIEMKTLTEDATKLLISYDWPGNVRELSNVIERACLISRESQITPEHLGITHGSYASTPAVALSLEEAEKCHVLSVLNSVDGDKAKAASLLGITLRHLYRKLEKYGN
jgi:transcriptional regulator with PAS, ATPase and Fis domain